MRNPYWKRDSVTLEEAFSLAEELQRRLADEILDYKEYLCCAGEEWMLLKGYPRAKVRVFWSRLFNKAGIDLVEDSWRGCAMTDGKGKWDGEFRLLGWGDDIELQHGFQKLLQNRIGKPCEWVCSSKPELL